MKAEDLVFGVVVLLLLSFAVIIPFSKYTIGGFIPYSDGERSGVVAKLSRKGLICKTWEGELALSGFRAGAEGSTSNVFYFSINDDSILTKIKDSMKDGKNISLQYEETFGHWPCSRETDYIITGVSQ